MAVVQCPNCGRPVSDQLTTCPDCGRSLAQPADVTPEVPEEKREWSLPLVLVIVLLVAGVGYAILSRGKSSDAKPEAAAPTSPAVAIDTAAVMRAANPAANPATNTADGAGTLGMAMAQRSIARTHLEELRAAVRQAVTAEEIQYNEKMTYTASTKELPEFSAAPGVHVTIVNATSSGFGVYATHDQLAGAKCAYFTGSAPAVAPATTAGQVSCTDIPNLQ